MLGVQRELDAQGLTSRMLLQVHDELVLEVAPGELATVEELLRTQMAGEPRTFVRPARGVGRAGADLARRRH